MIPNCLEEFQLARISEKVDDIESHLSEDDSRFDALRYTIGLFFFVFK